MAIYKGTNPTQYLVYDLEFVLKRPTVFCRFIRKVSPLIHFFEILQLQCTTIIDVLVH